MKNQVSIGDVLTFTATAPATGGNLIKIGSIVGVVAGSAAIGERVDVATRGVFTLDKDPYAAFTAGADVYADTDNSEVGEEDSAHLVKIGVAIEAAGLGVETAKVRLNGSF